MGRDPGQSTAFHKILRSSQAVLLASCTLCPPVPCHTSAANQAHYSPASPPPFPLLPRSSFLHGLAFFLPQCLISIVVLPRGTLSSFLNCGSFSLWYSRQPGSKGPVVRGWMAIADCVGSLQWSSASCPCWEKGIHERNRCHPFSHTRLSCSKSHLTSKHHQLSNVMGEWKLHRKWKVINYPQISIKCFHMAKETINRVKR